MTTDDVDLNFTPPEQMPVVAGRPWAHIVASALADVPGCVTMVLDHVRVGWLLHAFLWYEAGSPAFRSADPTRSAPLRRRVVDALKSEGKAVLTQH